MRIDRIPGNIIAFVTYREISVGKLRLDRNDTHYRMTEVNEDRGQKTLKKFHDLLALEK